MANRTEKKWANGGSRFVNLKFKLIVYFKAISIRLNFWGLLKKVEEERCSVLVGVIKLVNLQKKNGSWLEAAQNACAVRRNPK